MPEATTYPQSKSELLERMRVGREEWEALIAQIPEDSLSVPMMAGGWSVKDLLAHVAAFERWTAAQIRAAAENRAATDVELYGVEEMLPEQITAAPEGWDLDRENAAIYAQYKETSVTEVLTFSGQAFRDLVSAVEGVPEEDFNGAGTQSWTGEASLLEIVPGQCYAHYEQHIGELKAISGDDIP